MGNLQCRPKIGEEITKDFLIRKYHRLAKKHSIDGLVSIATHADDECDTTRKKGDHCTDIELIDLDGANVVEDDLADRNIDLDSDVHDPAGIYRTYDDLTKSKEIDVGMSLASNGVRKVYNDQRDVIMTIKRQMHDMQAELDKLQWGTFSTRQYSGRDPAGGSFTVRSIQYRNSRAPDGVASEASGDVCEGQWCRGFTFLQEQGDISKRFDEINNAGINGQAMVNTVGRRNRMHTKITEGLRTRTHYSKRRRNNETKRKSTAVIDRPIQTASEIASKIASLQKRDPDFPRPDKGVQYPDKIESDLTKEDKAYYVEQFMRSELFRQRCLRKYQGSKRWKNALTPFQIWVIEHEGTSEMEATLNPFPRKPDNSVQAKVDCWRGRTPSLPPFPLQ